MKETPRIGGVICFDCGHLYARYKGGVSSAWRGKCSYCGERTMVTDSRDFGYPTLPPKTPSDG